MCNKNGWNIFIPFWITRPRVCYPKRNALYTFLNMLTHCDGVARVPSNIVYLENDMVLLLWQGGINSDNFLFLDQVMSPDPRNRFFFFFFFSPFILWDFILFSSWRLSSGGVCSFGTTLSRFFLLEFANFYDLLKSTTSSQQWQAAGFILNQKLYDLSLFFFLRFYHVSNVPWHHEWFRELTIFYDISMKIFTSLTRENNRGNSWTDVGTEYLYNF